MHSSAVSRLRMNVWICAGVVPIWPAPAPTWKTFVRQPWARLAAANDVGGGLRRRVRDDEHLLTAAADDERKLASG